MKRVDIGAYGAPQEVAACVEVPDVGCRVRAKASSTWWPFRSIRPMSRSAAATTGCGRNCRRRRGRNASGGSRAVGAGVGHLRPGDLVVNMQRENWAQRRRVRGEDAVPIPAGLDLAQAAMLRINPPTAQLLIEDHVALKPGDWLIQDVANSAVGRHIIVLAKERGLHTFNVVRREDVAAELTALGADVVLQDGPDLPERARAAAGGAPIRLGIDAVSGAACRRLGDCVDEGGVLVNYGSMSGEDAAISRPALNMRGVSLTGFNLGRGLAKRTPGQVRALYANLAGKIRDGVLKAPIDAFFGIEEIKAALARAQEGHRNGKVLVLPNGPL